MILTICKPIQSEKVQWE